MEVASAVGTAFNAVKDVAVNIGSEVVDIGAGLLTSGLATGNFGSYQSGSNLNGFYNLIGEVMGAGGSAVTGALGMSPDGASSRFINTMASQAGNLAQYQNQQNQLGRARRNSVLAQGIMGGLKYYAQKREEEKARERENKSAIFGVRKRGSDGQSGLLQFPSFSMPQGAGQSGGVTQQGGVPIGQMQGPQPQQQQPLLAQQQMNQQRPPQPTGMQQTYAPNPQQNYNAQQAYYG